MALVMPRKNSGLRLKLKLKLKTEPFQRRRQTESVAGRLRRRLHSAAARRPGRPAQIRTIMGQRIPEHASRTKERSS